MKVIRQEMTLFENGGNRGRYLQLVYDYLLSIPPTSVEAERAFSASGLICSRLRTRLGDETLDAFSNQQSRETVVGTSASITVSSVTTLNSTF